MSSVEKDSQDQSSAKKSALATAVLCHEIRTTLNAMLSSISFLQQNNPRDSQVNDLNALGTAAQSLQMIVDSQLSLQVLENGQYNHPREEVSLKEFLVELQTLFKARANEQKAEIVVNLPENGVDLKIFTDKNLLRQILANLLSNALRHTMKGQIELIPSPDPRDQWITIKVKDSGCGIPTSEQGKIFEAFEQASNHTATSVLSSTGMGLYLVREFTQYLGGQVSLEHSSTHGSTFSLRLPRGSRLVSNRSSDLTLSNVGKNPVQQKIVRPEPKSIKETSSHHQIRKILIAEDDPLNQKILSRIVKKSGHEAHVVKNGTEVLDIVKTQDFDLIMLDQSMPHSLGSEVTKHLRKLSERLAKTPIIGFTGDSRPSEMSRCLEAGMDEVLQKPLSPERLQEKIESWLVTNDSKSAL